MNPALIALIIQFVQEAVTLAPGIVTDLQEVLNKPNPTPADWESLRQKVLNKSYADYVPASALTPATPPLASGGGAIPTASPNAPISQPGAISEAPTAVAEQNPPSTPETPAAPAAQAQTEAPYLPNGMANPAYKG